jgi:predicted Zn-dependent protease
MLRDGHPDRAASILEPVDPEEADLDLPRFYTLRGLARLQVQRHEEALTDFDVAVAAGQTDPMVHVYASQAHFKLDQFRDALRSIESARAGGMQLVGLYELEAECYWRLERKDLAWSTLGRAYEEHPGEVGLLRRKVFFAIELGLYTTAAAVGRVYMQTGDAGPDDAMAIGRALAESGRGEEALSFLQAAALQYPGERSLVIELARSYLDADQGRVAASILARRAHFDSELALEAADLYAKAGSHRRALDLNALAENSAAKLRQRLALLIALQQFGAVAAMERMLVRSRLLEDENIRYALAYAFFEIQDFERAEYHLGQLTDPTLFSKAMEIRELMLDCADSPWMCGT